MNHDVHTELISAKDLSKAQHREIVTLCTAAYQEEFAPYLALLPSPVHLLAWKGEHLLSHIAWVTRWLQVEDEEPRKTAYIEAVATAPEFQGQGYASLLLRKAVECMSDYEVAALSPSDFRFYDRLGWKLWQGPLSVRTPHGLEPTHEEQVMIYRLPHTIPLDRSRGLSIEWRPGEVW